MPFKPENKISQRFQTFQTAGQVICLQGLSLLNCAQFGEKMKLLKSLTKTCAVRYLGKVPQLAQVRLKILDWQN